METGAGGAAAGGGEEECGRAAAHGVSLFDYVERVHQRTPLFYNFLYTPDFDNPVPTAGLLEQLLLKCTLQYNLKIFCVRAYECIYVHVSGNKC